MIGNAVKAPGVLPGLLTKNTSTMFTLLAIQEITRIAVVLPAWTRAYLISHVTKGLNPSAVELIDHYLERQGIQRVVDVYDNPIPRVLNELNNQKEDCLLFVCEKI